MKIFGETESDWGGFVVLSNHKSNDKFLKFYPRKGKELAPQNGFVQEVWKKNIFSCILWNPTLNLDSA